MFAHLVLALEEKVSTTGPEDVLGSVFNELELYRKSKGQVFTPQHVSDLMAKLACPDGGKSLIEEKGYVSMCDPCCGAGVMITSMAKVMIENGLNYCTQLVCTATDIDLKCVHMTYLQCALYGIPAVIIHGDSLLVQEWSRWYTPVYIMNGWVWRQTCGLTDRRNDEDEKIRCVQESTYAAMRKSAVDFEEPTDAVFREIVVDSKKPAAAVPRKTALFDSERRLTDRRGVEDEKARCASEPTEAASRKSALFDPRRQRQGVYQDVLFR